MNDLLKEAEARDNVGTPSPARVFLEFKYPEVKDLLNHFLTLISASLVFSVTFSEKIIDFSSAAPGRKMVVICAWGLLLLALGACGLGIYTLYLAAERAVHTVLFRQPDDFEKLARRSYGFQDAAGALFGIGLLLLALAAVMRIVIHTASHTAPMESW